MLTLFLRRCPAQWKEFCDQLVMSARITERKVQVLMSCSRLTCAQDQSPLWENFHSTCPWRQTSHQPVFTLPEKTPGNDAVQKRKGEIGLKKRDNLNLAYIIWLRFRKKNPNSGPLIRPQMRVAPLPLQMATKWAGNTHPNKVSVGDGLWGFPQESQRTPEAPWCPLGSSSETLEVSHRWGPDNGTPTWTHSLFPSLT